MAEMTLERKAAQIKVKRLLAELCNRPMTPPEIAQFLHLAQQTVGTYLKVLKAEDRIHIKSWTLAPVAGKKGRPRPQWTIGPGKDAPRIAPVKKGDAHKKWYRKLKQDPAAYEAFKARCRQRYYDKKFVPRPDIAASWIPRREA